MVMLIYRALERIKWRIFQPELSIQFPYLDIFKLNIYLTLDGAIKRQNMPYFIFNMNPKLWNNIFMPP